jgi:hypothetical protein
MFLAIDPLKSFRRSLYSIVVVLTVSIASFSQKPATPGFPFQPGEKLVYEGKAIKIFSVAVADLTFTFTKAPNSENYLIKTEAVSKGTLLKLFRYSFLQEYGSLVDHDTFRIIKTTKHDVQKERVRDSVADFDYRDKTVTFVENDPKNPTRAPRRIASDLTAPMNDIVSAIYVMRTLPLSVGKTFDVPLSDSGLVYNVPVKVTAREQQKTAIGKLWCYRLEPALFGPGRFFDQNGKMIIWISDDARRIPVRGRIETESFKVEVKLRSVARIP